MGIVSRIKEWWNKMFENEAKKAFGVATISSPEMDMEITKWLDTYRGFPWWVDEKERIKSIKFAKAVCSETARLTTLALEIKLDGDIRAEHLQQRVDGILMPRLRNWVEFGCASGTVIFKPNGNGADLVTPDRFRIVGKDGNGNISGIIFQDTYQQGDKYYTKLEYHRFKAGEKETAHYMITNRVYRSYNGQSLGKECALEDTKWSNLQPEVAIKKQNGEELSSMLFGVFRMPVANDIDFDSPLGVSVFADAMEEMKDLDIAYSRYAGEIYDSESIELLDDRLINETGKKIGSGQSINLPHHVRNVYGNDTKDFYQAIERPLKTEERIRGINNQLSLVGYKCGYSNGYFVLDQKTGMVTATQVESDDRRTIQLIKDIRDSLQTAVTDYIYAESVFADLYNLAPAGTYDIDYSFGDITYNFEEDKLHHYNLACQGKFPWEEYYVKFLKYSRKEAKKLLEMAKKENKESGLLEDDE